MTKVSYIKCPRCELNYIDSRQDMCDVCKAELGLAKNVFCEEIEDDDDNVKMCPICKVTVIGADEDMCEACAAAAHEIEPEPDISEDDDQWKAYLDDEEDEALPEELEIPLEELQDEEFDSTFDDEEETSDDGYVDNEEDDFEEVNLDDIDDEEFDEDEEDEDEEEEDEEK